MAVQQKIKDKILAKYPCCLKCGSTKKLHVDHVIPQRYGGTDDESNLQTLCHKCNIGKGKKHIDYRSGVEVIGDVDPTAFYASDAIRITVVLPHDLSNKLRALAVGDDRTVPNLIVHEMRKLYLPKPTGEPARDEKG